MEENIIEKNIIEENIYLITFKKPYMFEGAEYKEIDLAGIEDLKAKDLSDTDKLCARRGQMAAMNEMSVGYACIIASKASTQPVEFFDNLPAKEAIKLKNKVVSFFYSQA